MSGRRSLLNRPLLLLATLATLVLAGAGPVSAATPPDIEQGQHGDVLWNDSSVTPPVTCRYKNSGPYKLYRLVARPPKVWWPDTDSAPNQHGKVTWQVRIQVATSPAGPWSTVYRGPRIKKTAYEGSYDTTKSAKWGTQVIDWNKPGPAKLYRVAYRVNWLTLGSVTHWVGYYKYGGTVPGSSVDYCYNRIAI